MDEPSTELEVASPGSRPWERRTLCRELAVGEMTHGQLAEKYSITRQAISAFAKRHAREIDDIRADLDNEFAGLWIADKSKRLAAYQHEYDVASEAKNADHHEWIKARTDILSKVSKELGQDSDSASAVQHVIVGVQVEVLQ